MLKVRIDDGKDYLEYLRPYVLQVLVEAPPDIISDAQISSQLRKLSGLEIPHRTVQLVLQRIAKDGYLKKADGVYKIIKDISVKNITAERAAAVRHITAVTHELTIFAEQGANLKITEEMASECLIAFLSQFSIPCLKSYLRGTTLPIINSQDDWQITLVSQFVNSLTTKPELFESFMTLVQGHMIANALLCPDLQHAPKSYKDVTFYFDTPLLIQLLGLEGIPEKIAVKELVELVQRLGGKIAYFSHTFDELVTAINSSAGFIDSPHGRGTIVDEARKSGLTKSDLIMVAQAASETFESLNIMPQATPPYDRKNFKFEISEEVFSNVLSDEVNYHNPRARDYDIKSVRSIYILRHGALPNSLERAGAVLVTNNTGFSSAAYEYGKKIEQSREVSAVITDFSLANTAWLKAPPGAPSLPRKEVLAFAYAALRPSKEFWNKVLDTAEKLEKTGKISPREHLLLRSSYHAQDSLMQLTLGQDTALTEKSIRDTLSQVTAELRKEEAEKLKLSEASRIKAEEELAKKTDETEEIKQKVFWRCDRKAAREAFALSISIWIAQALVAIFGVIKIVEDPKYTGALVIIIALLTGVLRMAGTFWDIKPLNVQPKFKEWRRANLLKKEYSILGIKS
jgi:hypothetical protein